MARREPTAAEAIYGHLPHQSDYVAKSEREASPLATSMYPRPKVKPPNYYRESLLQGLRELNARTRERRR
jgi:hypothetical protein